VARKRPTASNVAQPELICLDGGLSDSGPPLLTRAEAQALRHEQLKQRLQGVPKPPLREV